MVMRQTWRYSYSALDPFRIQALMYRKTSTLHRSTGLKLNGVRRTTVDERQCPDLDLARAIDNLLVPEPVLMYLGPR